MLQKMSRIIAGIILITFGFAFGAFSTNRLQGAQSTKYEYKLVSYNLWFRLRSPSIESIFNNMGAKGWKYTGTIRTPTKGTFAVFRRQQTDHELLR
jgi:hypothetical protein